MFRVAAMLKGNAGGTAGEMSAAHNDAHVLTPDVTAMGKKLGVLNVVWPVPWASLYLHAHTLKF